MLLLPRWRQDGGPDVGTPLPPVQPVERPIENAMVGGGNGDGLESGPMPTGAGL